MRLIDERTLDGSRCFARLPYVGEWQDVCEQVSLLPNHEWTTLANTHLQEGTLRFRFHGYYFELTYRRGELCFVVRDPLCFDLLLYQVACHFAELSDRTRLLELPDSRTNSLRAAKTDGSVH